MHRLRTNCAQPVPTSMNNQWVQYPQGTRILWKNDIRPVVLSPRAHFFLRIVNYISPMLCAPNARNITDKIHYFSTLSTSPITTTTIYI